MEWRQSLSLPILALGLALNPIALYAAKSIQLNQQNTSILNTFTIQEINRALDLNHTLHIRLQEMYAGYPVWGADAVLHIPQATNTHQPLVDLLKTANGQWFMNGIFYQDLTADLASAPDFIFKSAQADQALQKAIDHYQHQVGTQLQVKNAQSQLIIYIDNNKKAHFAYQVRFYIDPLKKDAPPAKPIFIMDAISFQLYAQWDDIKTTAVDAAGGGFGGNIKMGQLTYDGSTTQLASLALQRDAETNTCYFQNNDVIVKDMTSGHVVSFGCTALDPTHNNVYWDADFDAVNDGYSPANDAIYGGELVKQMYQDWYHIPALVNTDGSPMKLNMFVHRPNYDNAFWDGIEIVLGDGYTSFYPLTSVGVIAHEVSHGFTQQHANLVYSQQSGGMNEAFSDMAAQAAELYSTGQNSWQIGGEICKEAGKSLRYMDQPSKDCEGKTPGDHCSIDNATQYYDGLDVHYSSGVFNHAFYLLSTSPRWDAKKAFNVMEHANAYYWTSHATFTQGACGAIQAAKDLKYDVSAVRKAFNAVAVKTFREC